MRTFIYVLLIIPLLLGSCKKSVELDIIESRCSDFSISNGTGELTNPNINTGLTGNTFIVEFNYNGDQECLNLIDRRVTFFDQNQNEISPISADLDTISASDPLVSVNNGRARFSYTFEMADPTTYNNIQYAVINFNTENITGSISNKLSVLIIMPGKSIPPPTNLSQQFIVRGTNLRVELFDDASEDGDIVTIIVNGQVIANNVTIFNRPQVFNFTINPNTTNYITFLAVNEGSSSPNTVAGTVIDGFNAQSFNVGMRQGETISFDLVFSGL